MNIAKNTIVLSKESLAKLYQYLCSSCFCGQSTGVSTKGAEMHRGFSRGTNQSAFTLMELLVVVLVISVILTLTAPAINESLNASRLTSSGDELLALLSEAQQTVSTEGIALEVQFLKHPPTGDPNGVARYRTAILLRRYEKGQPSPEPAKNGSALESAITLVTGTVFSLPNGFLLSENSKASTLMSDSTDSSVSGSGKQVSVIKILRGGVLTDYEFPNALTGKAGFILRSEGTNLNAAQKWFVTIANERDEISGREPSEWKNFYCIQVNPVTGGITSYRP